MKNKTKFLFVSFGVLFAALSAVTINLYMSQRDMKKSLAEAEMRQTSMNENQTPIFRASFMTNDEGESFVDAAEKTVNTVVHIRTEIVSKGNSYYDFFGSLLEQIYGGQMQIPNNVSVGYGSGVVISPDGYIVTNNHVVEGASKIEVTFNDKHKRTATIIGNDPSTDLALIKVDAKDLEYLTFADSDRVRVGEWVLAVGNPFNLTSTVTAGIVSAKARNINILGDGSTIESFIQTDAAIASRTGSYEGYSFAIPSNIVKKVVEDFLQYGALQRAYIGVSIAEITEELARAKGIEVTSGVYVIDVHENGGAMTAGIKKDDIILSINNITVNSNAQLIGVIGQYRPGNKVKVKLQRNGNIIEKEVTLKNLDGTEEMHRDTDSFYNEVLGIRAQALPSSLKSELGINYGLKIVEVKDGIFKQKGITDDFIILSVNYQKVSSENDLKKALSSDRNGKTRIEGTNSTGTYNITFEFYR